MSAWRSALVVGLVAGIVGCRENITTSGRCPSLCPRSNVQLADTLLAMADSADTSVRGFVLVREASYLLASSLDSLQSVALIRFTARDTSWTAADTGSLVDTEYIGRQDSVGLTLQILQRDTAVKNLRLVVYRLPAQLDTAATYASIPKRRSSTPCRVRPKAPHNSFSRLPHARKTYLCTARRRSPRPRILSSASTRVTLC